MMRLNILAILFALCFAVWAQEKVPPPADFTTKTLTSTTTLTQTVTVSLIAAISMIPPPMNISIPTGAYPTASEPSVMPLPSATKPGDDYNVPTPPKETATFVPDNGARYVMGNKALLGAAGLVAALAIW